MGGSFVIFILRVIGLVFFVFRRYFDRFFGYRIFKGCFFEMGVGYRVMGFI